MKKSFIRFTLLLCLLIASMLMGIHGCGGSDGGSNDSHTTNSDANGNWNVTEVADETDCGEGTNTYLHTAIITQSGSSVTLTLGGNSFVGNVSGNLLTWSGSYSEDGGTTTTSVRVTISSDGLSFTGSATWSWTSGSSSCSGTSQLTGTKNNSGGDGDGDGGTTPVNPYANSCINDLFHCVGSCTVVSCEFDSTQCVLRMNYDNGARVEIPISSDMASGTITTNVYGSSGSLCFTVLFNVNVQTTTTFTATYTDASNNVYVRTIEVSGTGDVMTNTIECPDGSIETIVINTTEETYDEDYGTNYSEDYSTCDFGYSAQQLANCLMSNSPGEVESVKYNMKKVLNLFIQHE